MLRKLSQAKRRVKGRKKAAVGTEFADMDLLLKVDPAVQHRKNGCRWHERAG